MKYDKHLRKLMTTTKNVSLLIVIVKPYFLKDRIL